MARGLGGGRGGRGRILLLLAAQLVLRLLLLLHQLHAIDDALGARAAACRAGGARGHGRLPRSAAALRSHLRGPAATARPHLRHWGVRLHAARAQLPSRGHTLIDLSLYFSSFLFRLTFLTAQTRDLGGVLAAIKRATLGLKPVLKWASLAQINGHQTC